MVDFRRYISLDAPDTPQESYVMPQGSALRNNVTRALQEIASTPEGQALLEKAAAHSPSGKIHILHDPDNFSFAMTNGVIAIGNQDSRFQYYSPETGGLHDITMQHFLVHELSHFALGHAQMRGDEIEGAMGVSLSKEAEAVAATNAYMAKYYGEPPRDLDTMKGDISSGTQGWDFNHNFKGGRIKASLDNGLPAASFDSYAGDPAIQAEAMAAGLSFAGLPEPEASPSPLALAAQAVPARSTSFKA